MRPWYIAVVFSCIMMRNICTALIPPQPHSSYHHNNPSSASSGQASGVPLQLREMMSKGLLANPHPNLYILGTVHIGSRSSDDVQSPIEIVKPSAVIVEVPPSRFKRIQKRVILNKQNQLQHQQQQPIDKGSISSNRDTQDEKEPAPKQQSSLVGALSAIPSLASEGYSKGGISGLIFSTIIVGGSLLKRSMTSNEEDLVLPRNNEFETAIVEGLNIGSTIIPADIEFDKLINKVAADMNAFDWVKLGLRIFYESIGLSEGDPIRRKEGESMSEWESRRRDINVARTSRLHGEKTVPKLSKILVQYRDAEFARICLEVIDANYHHLYHPNDQDDQNNEDDKYQENSVAVCIVGLVHLDGIVSIIRDQKGPCASISPITT